jgi:hypothetical protein
MRLELKVKQLKRWELTALDKRSGLSAVQGRRG